MPVFHVTTNGKTIEVTADNLLEIVSFMRKENIGGKVIKVSSENGAKFNVTCGWGIQAHKWQATKAEAIAHKNVCPEHRKEA